MALENIDQCLEELDLTQAAAAEYLSVNPRTVRRWVEDPSQISGAAEQALRAWQLLKRHGIEWRPKHIALGNEQLLSSIIDDYRRQTYEIVDLAVKRVHANGGPKTPSRGCILRTSDNPPPKGIKHCFLQ